MKTTTNNVVPINDIKEEISFNIGKNITVKEFNKQRKLTHKYVGTIKAVYDSVFLVDVNINSYRLNKSFSYVGFSIGDMEYQLEI